jgi:putative hydrolase of the HAD superfamily
VGRLDGVRAVFFDAVGTLIVPDPPAADAYAEVGRRHGSGLDVATVRRRFRDAFDAEEERDARAGWWTSDGREFVRWERIVRAVFAELGPQQRAGCFMELHRQFARPSAWRVTDGAEAVLEELRRRGLVAGVASNFDGRLRSVTAGLPELAPVERFVISSEVGWRKPARQFFEAVVREAGCAPGEVLLVGDDAVNDYEGASAAGLRALLLDPDSEPGPGRIRHLANLIEPPAPSACC